MLSPPVCWQSGPLRMTPLETILMEKATRSIAARMLARGLERQTVQELTGLSDEELAALAP